MIRIVASAVIGTVLLAGGAVRADQANPGDIPDTQVFVDYQSPLGFSIKVPEGWARTTTADGVTFAERYDTIAVRVTQAPAPGSTHRAYSSVSAANPVTGKTTRLENEQYQFWNAGRLATLTLSAPAGADNADQWHLISHSFRWN